MKASEKIEEIASAVAHEYKSVATGPFPYTGCFKIIDDLGTDYEGLIPDLDMHTLTIAGYADSVEIAERWGQRRLSQMREHLQKSFFEKHPGYKELKKIVTSEYAPDLYRYLIAYEKMRVQLLRLIPLLLPE